MPRIAIAVLATCLLAVCASAGEPITIGEIVTLQSKVMGEQRTILVSTPPGYERSTERYPVLYMTDGDQHITHTRGTVDFLAANGLIPQLIIVGVANTDRTRDLSPSHMASWEDDGLKMEFPTSGGAAAFLDFFASELFSFVDTHYRTVPLRLFSGHSLGGLFALKAFFEYPEMFKGVMAISPGLFWDDDLMIREAADFAKTNAVVKATLFVAMANEESGDPEPTRLDRLEETLAASKVKDFRWRVMRMPDEDHGSVVLRAQYWGLREIFDGWRPPVDPATQLFDGSLADMQAHYLKLSRTFGFLVVPAEGVVNALGYQFLAREELDAAIEIFSYNVELYPSSANVYDSLGEAYEKAGRLEEALANYTKAVENAAKIGDNNLGVFTANRDRAQELVAQAEAE